MMSLVQQWIMMKQAAKDLDFERATELRDMLFELKAEG